MTITDKLNELKSIRDKITHHKWIYSELVEQGMSANPEGLEGVEVVSEHDHEIICSLDKDQVNDWRDSAKFIVAAANNWNTLIECLELAICKLDSIKKDHYGDSTSDEANEALAEIESKLGGI